MKKFLSLFLALTAIVFGQNITIPATIQPTAIITGLGSGISGIWCFVGGTSGQACFSVQTVAGTPSIMFLPVVDPIAGQVLMPSTPSGGAYQLTWASYPDQQEIPAAKCNNATGGNSWSIGSGGTVSCRAGTNNLGGFIVITDTSSTFAQFQIIIPEDWNSSINPYIRFQVASTDGTAAHTIIPQIKVSCAKGDGTTTDDVTFNAAHSSSTITLNSTVNQFWSNSNMQLNNTDMTGCVAGGMMTIQVGRASDTATNAEFYGATMTFLRNLNATQAN